MPTAPLSPRDLSKPTRPLYLRHVPTPIWEQVHINAIRSGLGLTAYLVSVLANTEPLPVTSRQVRTEPKIEAAAPDVCTA
jgi:hypothetical protein